MVMEQMFDNFKALGILFHANVSNNEEEIKLTPYEWDDKAMEDLVKSMGYEDFEDIAGEMMHYFSPGDEDEMRIFRIMTGISDLQPTDLTIGMYKRVIEQEFSK